MNLALGVKKPAVTTQQQAKPTIKQVAGKVGTKTAITGPASINYLAEEKAQTIKKEFKVGDTIHTKEQRLQALGAITPGLDPLLIKILKNAESLYLPKKILSIDDWLMSNKEKP